MFCFACRFEELVKLAASRGFLIDTSTNKSLALSLSKAELPDKTFNQLLRTLTTQAMEEAEYISTGTVSLALVEQPSQPSLVLETVIRKV
jgi:hypothetical protein